LSRRYTGRRKISRNPAKTARRRPRVFSLDKLSPTEPRDGIVYLEADVTDPASVAEAFKAIDAVAGRLNILLNNAGIQRVGLVGQVSFADWSAVIATHLNGFFLCA
jgi:NAD(P)-dependent dehydrogenase (short-subunit alcohol dehydrogenase family)